MSKDLTDKQQKIYEYIRSRIFDSGIPPTVREIGDHFGITVKGAYDHLKAIEKKGFIRCEQNKSRSIELLVDKEERIPSTVAVPFVGTIAAGAPILAEENVTEYFDFPRSLLGSGEYFALKVRGDSMIGAGIFDGDIAVIEKADTARDGVIVAALVEGEATLKRIKKQSQTVQLLPENPAYRPIESQDAQVLGTLCAIYRNY
ncbi:MAG TPA: transcriptional repressor LexA [Spirochaetota bacterium]